jgi:hypothetical protein
VRRTLAVGSYAFPDLARDVFLASAESGKSRAEREEAPPILLRPLHSIRTKVITTLQRDEVANKRL